MKQEQERTKQLNNETLNNIKETYEKDREENLKTINEFFQKDFFLFEKALA